MSACQGLESAGKWTSENAWGYLNNNSWCGKSHFNNGQQQFPGEEIMNYIK